MDLMDGFEGQNSQETHFFSLRPPIKTFSSVLTGFTDSLVLFYLKEHHISRGDGILKKMSISLV